MGQSSSNDVKPEYMPIELYLSTIVDYEKVAWLMDNCALLRSVFKICEITDDQLVLTMSKAKCVIRRTNGKWRVKSSIPVVGSDTYKGSNIFHLLNGTALLIDNDIVYHLCFEECPDNLFDDIKKKCEFTDTQEITSSLRKRKVTAQ